MEKRVSLKLIGLIVAPCTIVAFVLGLVFASVFNLTPRVAEAQVSSTQPITGQESPFVAVAEKVIPTVVNISAEKVVKSSEESIFPNIEGPFEEFFKEFFRGMPVPEQHINSLGSGVIISEDGYIVTNNHVVAGYDNIVVKLSDGTEFKGKNVKIVGRDQETDLAVIKINAKSPLPAIKYADPASIKVGDWAIAIGNPFGLQSTVTVGVISATGRSGIPLPEGPTRQDFIQTDAAINPGNSGGALVNIRGELIGINTALRSPVGANVGIGFAVPVRFVKSVVEQLIAHGKVVRGYLGIRPQEVTDNLRRALKLEDKNGVLISEVLPNTPAEKAGLQVGDVIVEVNGVPPKGVEQFRQEIAEMKPGTKVNLTIIRQGQKKKIAIILGQFPEETQARGSIEKEKSEGNWLGLKVSNLSLEEEKVNNVKGGVKVVSVESGSTGDKAGIEPGDVIVKIGEEEIRNKSHFIEVIEKLSQTKEPVLCYIKRAGQPMFVAIEP
ncbi:MAG: Do family serine endopeptidase [candidate division WOR-3 bacterium]